MYKFISATFSLCNIFVIKRLKVNLLILVAEDKFMKRYITIGLLLLAGSIIGALELEINYREQIMDYGDPVIIDITMTNETDEIVVAPIRFIPEEYYIKFIIVDKNGTRVPFKGLDFSVTSDEMDLMELPPKSQFTIHFDISRFYDLRRGVYAMMAYYHVPEGKFEDDIWYGKIVSKQLNIGIR